MPEMRQISLRCRREGCRRSEMAQNVLQMWNVQQNVGLNELCRTRRRALLQDLPRAKIRTQGLRLWWWCWMSQHGHRRSSPKSVNSRTSAAKTSQSPQVSTAAGNQTPIKPYPVLVTSSLSLSKFEKHLKFGKSLVNRTSDNNSNVQFKLSKFLNLYRLPVYILYNDYNDLRSLFWRIRKLQKEIMLDNIANLRLTV
ncbi:UNVERIFIED_CONTAM: hypothetical protein PYX00_005957 [Menopon gallinae]|uniref:Uncharacterized protein n=1 Tax=Menopon gallinae TaxID=328185 RepID=A0AAW2HTJ8_9NEOP